MTTERVPDPLEFLQHRAFAGGGGICIYAWHWAGNSFFEVATAICSRDDVYDEKVAEEMVRHNAVQFQCIKLPLRADSPRYTLDANQFEILVTEALYRTGF
jgi:hypothetical protein